ncbi:MAG TPA: NAD(P)-dependent alcohol dehydrogenase [Thermoplasmata archaeon]|nr:NAD(P)-dependent alcohol dehydrogenase [Thermoplasmata archaeon]
MKAWTFDRYGPPDVLAWTDVPLPTFRDEDELLVRVRAASVNPADRHSLKPPFLLRRRQGFLRPRLGRLGSDFAGRIEEVGKNVKDLRVGDEVFGVGRGTFAEYAVADQSQVMLRPAGLSPEQAAAAPIAGVTALQGLRDRGHLGPGQRVLINGASGGVGTYAVQIAAALGAEVSAVSGPQNVEQTRSLGASRVFDYSTEDFTRSGLRWDLIVDTQLNHSLAQYRAALNRRGTLVAIGAGPGPVGTVLRRLLGTWAASQIVGPRLRFFIASIQRKSLEEIAALLVSGKVTSVIDRRYPLSEVPAAIRYLAEGHARGKILVTYGT